VSYSFAVAEAADALDDPLLARRLGDGFVLPLSSFLLRPLECVENARYRVTVRHSAADAIVVPLPETARDTFVGMATPHGYALPAAAFGPVAPIRVGPIVGARASARASDGRDPAPMFDRWILAADRAANAYFGASPSTPRVATPRVMLLLTDRGGEGVGPGFTTSWGMPLVEILLGPPTEAALADDWVLLHELLHTRFPRLDERHHWLEEGIATYVEPLARARAGLIDERAAWSGMLDGLPNGAPAPEEGGLDQTPTWAATYWGGALFCLLADLEIRERTADRRGLEHALAAIANASIGIDEHWPIERVTAVGDAATGTTVLADLYASMGRKHRAVDLPRLFDSLGVSRRGESVVLDDRAPLAARRRALFAATPAPR
jgi:hypothetical protein